MFFGVLRKIKKDCLGIDIGGNVVFIISCYVFCFLNYVLLIILFLGMLFWID